MALSQNEVDSLLSTASVVAKFLNNGGQLSEYDQKIFTSGSSLFQKLVEQLPSLSNYIALAQYTQGKEIDDFAKTVSPSVLAAVAEIVEKEIAEEKRIARIKQLHRELVDLLLYLYKEKPDKEKSKFGWDDIPSRYQIDFKELANLEKLSTGYDAYTMIRREAGLPPEGENKEEKKEDETAIAEKEEKEEVVVEKPRETEITAGKADLNILAANIAGMADQQALVAQIRQKYHDISTKDQERLIRIAVKTAQLRLITEYAKNANEETLARAQALNQEVNPKLSESPLNAIETASRDLIAAAVAASGITFEDHQFAAAVENCTNLIVANGESLTAASRNELAEIVQLSLAASGNGQYSSTSPTARLYQTLNQSIQENKTTLDSNGNLVIPAGQTTLNKDFAIFLPDASQLITMSALEASVIAQGEAISSSAFDAIENSTKSLPSMINSVTLSSDTANIISKISQSITSDQVQAFVTALNQTLPNVLIRSFPTKQARVVEGVASLIPGNPQLDPKVPLLYSMGLTAPELAQVYQHAAANPNSPLGKFLSNPQSASLVRALNQGVSVLSNPANQIGRELNPSTTGVFQRLGQGVQTFTNRLSSIIPPQVGKYVNVVFHPIQFLQNQIGGFVSRQITGKIRDWAVKQVASKVANEALKKGLELIIKKGLQEGLKTLLVQGSAALGLDLTVAATGVGIPLALALLAAEVAVWLLKETVGLVKKAVDGIAVMMTGEKFDGKALVAAPLIALAGLGGVLGSLAAATAVAVSSAAIVIMGSAFAGFFLYMTVITVAPIITTIAHLESGISDVSRVGVIGGPAPAPLPPGPLPDSCPNGPPVTGFGITQGPGVGSHTSGWSINIAGVGFVSQGQAIDYGTPMNTPINATHDGQAYYYQAGDNKPDGYGNYVAIIGNCPNPATGQTVQFLTTYAHLNAGNIKRGGPTAVTRGQMIGLSDNTGHSTGPHLHYEIFGLGDIYRYVGP